MHEDLDTDDAAKSHDGILGVERVGCVPQGDAHQDREASRCNVSRQAAVVSVEVERLREREEIERASGEEAARSAVGSEADGVLPLLVRLRERAEERPYEGTAPLDEPWLVECVQYMGDDGG